MAGFAVDADTLRLVAAAVGLILAWELFRRLLSWSLVAKKPPVIVEAPSDFKDFPVPLDPHFEIAFDPPQGLHHSNPKTANKYDCVNCSGSYLVFHRPTGPNTMYGPGGFDYGEYFQCRRRIWEMRFQMKFRKAPKPGEDLFFGIELDEYVPMNQATRHTQQLVVKGMKQAVGGIYHSAGDSPGSVSGEMELPVCSVPLWALDQFIVTPEGEEPPKLWDKDFPTLGSRRYQRVKEYAAEIQELRRSIRVGPTYTFSFWGTSRFLDVIDWTVIGVPVFTPVSFDKFAGKAPVYVSIYSLPANDQDPRHLMSRKTYYFRCALWSSLFRPARRRIEALTGQVFQKQRRDMDLSPTSRKSMSIGLKVRVADLLKQCFPVCGIVGTLRPQGS